jgi:hypothetical protein
MQINGTSIGLGWRFNKAIVEPQPELFISNEAAISAHRLTVGGDTLYKRT